MKKVLTKKQLKAMEKGKKEKNKVVFVFENHNYKIEKIYLNYKITIKCDKKNVRRGVERDWYSSPAHGVKEAHATAEFAMEEHFIKDKITKEVQSL